MTTAPPICCRQPDLYEAWIPCWPFSATYCKGCRDVVATFGAFRQFLFDAFVYPFTEDRFKVKVTTTRAKHQPRMPWKEE